MQLYFIRHAESTNNLLYVNTGSDKGRSIDPEVTERGSKQIEMLANFLKPTQPSSELDADPLNLKFFPITHIYSSPMVRALITASGIARSIGKKVQAWVDLHETGGIVEKDEISNEYVGLAGNSRSYLVHRFPEVEFPLEIPETGWWNRPAEPFTERLPRAKRVLDELVNRHGNTHDGVVLVSHGAFYNYFMSAVMDFPYNDLFLCMANTAITRIDFEPTYRAIQYMNRFDFLPKDIVTP